MMEESAESTRFAAIMRDQDKNPVSTGEAWFALLNPRVLRFEPHPFEDLWTLQARTTIQWVETPGHIFQIKDIQPCPSEHQHYHILIEE